MTNPDNTMKGNELGSILPLWAEEKSARAYEAWHPVAVTFFQPTIAALIAEGEVRPGMQVLDIGTGTGIPALAVADAVGPGGHVVASDPSSAMLAAAKRNAEVAGLANVSFARAVAESLPFADGAFDAVLSHAGIMFAADLQRALAEIARVTRPGARAAFLAWGPVDQNPWLTGFWDAVARFREKVRPADEALPADSAAPEAAPDPRTPFRFATPGSLSDALRQVFENVREGQRSVVLQAPGRADDLLEFLLRFSGFDQELPDDFHQEFREEVLSAYGAYSDGQQASLPASIVIGSGRSPDRR